MTAISSAAGAATLLTVRDFVHFLFRGGTVRARGLLAARCAEPVRQERARVLRTDDARAPAASARKTPSAPSRCPSVLLDGRTVLIVDDNETNIFVLQAFLAAFGPAEIITARSGEKALAILNERRCDLIFMDIQMPGIDGVETTRLIRSGAKCRAQTPIIAVTAACRVFGPGDAAEAGMDGYVEKPVSRDLLRAEIEKAAYLADRRRGRSA